MDVKDMPEEWFAPSGYRRETDADGGERPCLLVYVDNHPEGYTYPLYRVLEALKDMGVEPYVFGPVFGSLEGYRMTRKEFEERERGLTPLLFLCHGATFEYVGRTFSVQDSAFTAPDVVHLHHRMLRHDMDFLTYNEVYGGEYLYNEMVDRLAWLLTGVARAVLGPQLAQHVVLPQGAFWQMRDIHSLKPRASEGPAVHVFVGTPVTPDTLPFWVRFLLRVVQRGGHPVLGGPHWEELDRQLRIVWDDLPIYPLSVVGVFDTYYAVISAPTDYKLKDAAYKHAEKSGARTLQWVQHGPGFFTGTDWYRTLGNLGHFDAIRDTRHFPTYGRSYFYPRSNMNGDVLPSPSIPLPEPVVVATQQRPATSPLGTGAADPGVVEEEDLASAPEFFTWVRARRVWGIVARAQAEKVSLEEEAALVADFKAAMGAFLPPDLPDAAIFGVLRRSKLPRIMAAVQKIRERHLGPVEELSRIAQLEITEVEDAKLFGGIDEALASEDTSILKHLQEKEEREWLREFLSTAASYEQETGGLTGAASIAAAEDARTLERLKKMAESTDPERTSSTQQRPADGVVVVNEWIERWVSDERVPPPTVHHVPTVLVFEDDPTSLLHPAFLHALGEHFRLAGYRMLVLPAPDSSFRRSKGAWTKEKDRRSAEFLRELKGDISAVLHITWGDPSSRDFSEEARDLLRALPYSGKGVLDVVHLEARKLRSSRCNIVDAASWQLDADAATYLFRSLVVLHNVLWNNATEEQQSRWPLPSPADYPTANMLSFSVFPVQQASTLLPVAVVFPSNRKGYTLRNAKNLARFFRGLGMEILPVSDSVGIATRSNGEFASILARHYAQWVPVLIVEGEDAEEVNSMWDSPLNWRTVQYRYTESKERRLDRLEEFLEAVRDHLREGSPHYASREKFRMDRPAMIAIDVETSELNPND